MTPLSFKKLHITPLWFGFKCQTDGKWCPLRSVGETRELCDCAFGSHKTHSYLPLITLFHPIKPLISVSQPHLLKKANPILVEKGEEDLKMSCSSNTGGSIEDLRYQYLRYTCGSGKDC